MHPASQSPTARPPCRAPAPPRPPHVPSEQFSRYSPHDALRPASMPVAGNPSVHSREVAEA